ncbi:hypothetical protein LCGC14_3161920 [marine sediment metagenome]|uniref:Lipoprotein n=1 Tax=marine sediment metagenome TaxID=412755 RepID=A0A0F8WF62_9ZZZZ
MKLDCLLLLAVLGIVFFLSGCVTLDKSIKVNINLDNVDCGEKVCGTWPVWVWIDYSTESEQDVSPNTTTKLK